MDTTLSAPIGQLLDGRYLVESQIARGGMATVYLARDVRLDRTVALKIAHPELARDQEFVDRFISEARSVARLSSPNVVAVFDQGSTGDLHYIAMEYVPGPTLRQLLNARTRLAPREALDIIERVLAGLGAAHDAGIIHRDVKPENVLLGNGTSVKVADFGLARAASGVSHTRTGLLIGTAAYLAPEQVAANSSDERTDVYAAGVMLFEMLTGVQPHTGETPLAVAYKHVNAVVPAPSTVNPDLPSALDALVALGTSRDPELRPADAKHYLKAIAEVRRGLPLPKPSGTRRDAAAPGADASGYSRPGGAVNGHSAGADGGFTPAAGLRDGSESDGTGPLPVFGGPADAGYGGAGGGRGQANHTMIVKPGGDDYDYAGGGGYPARQQRRYRHSEPFLQRWLFSRRIFIILAVVVLAGIGWWVIEGQYTSVPNIAGTTLSLARSDLQTAQLKVATGKAQHSDTVPRGQVIATNPAPGTRIRHGSTVTLITSLGPVLVQMPSVTGEPLATAQAALRSAGLSLAQPVSYQTSTTIPAGVVISTNPAAYQSWPKNKPVKLVLSAGPPLPDFAGQQVSAAQAAAAVGGYSINPVQLAKSSAPANTIVRQSPAPGSRITAGMVVIVYFSAGPPMVPVPNVDGLPEQQAIKQLQAAGFQVSVNGGLGNKVTGYNPQGQAPQGSTITINVGFQF
jgi:beta-lactam-binding protein with PASTA domain/tRNA A-37 threonylcarbamoyl transferase component Bud32